LSISKPLAAIVSKPGGWNGRRQKRKLSSPSSTLGGAPNPPKHPALGVAIIHPDPSEKFQILFDKGQATSHGS
jgi:hypothetical protein